MTNYYYPPVQAPSPDQQQADKKDARFRMVLALAVVAAVVVVIVVGAMASRADTRAFSVTVTGCSQSAGVGQVTLAVTNNTVTTRTARVSIEYRDADDSRLDTDMAVIRDVRPGQTARVTEYTFLDATPAGTLTCAATTVR